ncbi:MAG: peptidylprolyl isomerase [Oscillospiraceae bacterium]
MQELAQQKSSDSRLQRQRGGLYENVALGQMVEAFNDWIFDTSRKAGDVGIVETDYGCHLMYFVGPGKYSFRMP